MTTIKQYLDALVTLAAQLVYNFAALYPILTFISKSQPICGNCWDTAEVFGIERDWLPEREAGDRTVPERRASGPAVLGPSSVVTRVLREYGRDG